MILLLETMNFLLPALFRNQQTFALLNSNNIGYVLAKWI